MSYQVGPSCFPDAGTALSAIASLETGKVVPAGSVVYVVDAVPGVGTVTYTLHDVAGIAADVVYTSTPTLQPCGLLDSADALALGWGVVAAWVAAYALLALRKGL